MLKRFVFILALVLIPSVAACDGGPLFNEDGFRVERAVPASLVLINNSQQRVYYFVADRDALALIDWVPCIDPQQCVGIDPGDQARVAYPAIAGYQPGSGSAVVYWWLLVPNGSGGHRPDRIRSVDVEL